MSNHDEIRLTSTSFVVLGLIDYIGPSSPYDLKQMLQRSIADFHPVPHTTFYAEPARLAAAGYLDETQDAEGRRRKQYTLTDKGRTALAEWVAEPDSEPAELRSPEMLKIFFGADPEPIAAAAIARHSALLEGFEAIRANAPPRLVGGPRAALDTGIEYHRFWIEAWKQLRHP